jgi:predicted transcriptional regulator
MTPEQGQQAFNNLVTGSQAIVSNYLMAQREQMAQRDLSLREKAYERDDELHKAENALATLTTQKQIEDFRTRERLAPAVINFNTSMEAAHAAYHKSYDPSVYENIQIPNEILESNNPELISAAQQQKRQAYQMAVENSLNVTEEGAITELAKGVNGLTRANPSMGLLASNRLRAILAKREERKRDTGKAFFDDSDVEILNDISGMIDQQNMASSQRELAPKIIPAQYQSANTATYSENAATKEAISGANAEAETIIKMQLSKIEQLNKNKSDRYKEMNDTATTNSIKTQIQGQIKDIDAEINEQQKLLNQAVQVKRQNSEAGAQAYATTAGRSQQNIQGIRQVINITGLGHSHGL